MMKRVISLAIAIVIGHLGLKFYLHQQIVTELDKIVTAASPFFKVDYRGVSTSFLDKSFSVENIEIIPTSGSAITIDSISLYGAEFFATSKEWFNTLDFEHPRNHGVDIQGLVINLDDMLTFSSMAPGPSKTKDLQKLKELGYEKMDMDLGLRLRTYPDTKYIEIEYEQNHKNMFNIGVQATLTAQNHPKGKLNSALSPEYIQLVKAQLTFTDDSILEKVHRREANDKGTTMDDVKVNIMQELVSMLEENQLSLTTEHMQAITNFVHHYEPITISVSPKSPLGVQALSHMHLYKPADVTKMLNLDITNN
jgi:hypothetical protein